MPADSSYTFFGRLCILTLAIEWILFGSMHFSEPAMTIAQLPDYFPAATKLPIVIVSGIAEVAVGILILVPEMRKIAATGSLVLLVLLLPAMYEILASGVDPVKAGQIPGWLRVGLLPNNIFLAICSVHLRRHPHLRLSNPSAEPRPFLTSRNRSGDVISVLIAALLLIANCAGFIAAAWPGPGMAVTTLWGMACIAVGALIGFLFAVPRLNPAVEIRTQLIPNANVEAVSDWLTKILVGVGLVNFQAIGRFVDQMAAALAVDSGKGKAFALGVIVYFFAVGIIQGYILTRIFLSERFRAELGDQAAARLAEGG
jgi:uncharacterized membrane protein